MGSWNAMDAWLKLNKQTNKPLYIHIKLFLCGKDLRCKKNNLENMKESKQNLGYGAMKKNTMGGKWTILTVC